MKDMKGSARHGHRKGQQRNATSPGGRWPLGKEQEVEEEELKQRQHLWHQSDAAVVGSNGRDRHRGKKKRKTDRTGTVSGNAVTLFQDMSRGFWWFVTFGKT